MPVWSLANIDGMSLSRLCTAHSCRFDQRDMDRIFHQTRGAAREIIERKGATYYAVAAGLMRIVEAILRDQRTVLSVSSLIEEYHGISDASLSLPTVVDPSGVAQVLRLDLNSEEIQGLRRSAEVLKATIAKLKLE